MLQIGRVKRARENIQYLHMDAVDISLSGKFDLIVSRTTLHHIDDKVQVIEKLKSLLTDHGKLVILDNVSENPTPKRYLNIAGAYLDLIPNLIKFGVTRGIRIFKHSLSKDWLDHLDSDVYLSETQTKNLYQGVLPGNSLSRFHVFMGVVWEADHEKRLRCEPLE
jgi:SAM-dependent methyltransferase